MAVPSCRLDTAGISEGLLRSCYKRFSGGTYIGFTGNASCNAV